MAWFVFKSRQPRTRAKGVIKGAPVLFPILFHIFWFCFLIRIALSGSLRGGLGIPGELRCSPPYSGLPMGGSPRSLLMSRYRRRELRAEAGAAPGPHPLTSTGLKKVLASCIAGYTRTNVGPGGRE